MSRFAKPCDYDGCEKMLEPQEQFGPDYLYPLCLEHWREIDDEATRYEQLCQRANALPDAAADAHSA